jgi:putative ABC transport system substrate-binding protein
MRRRDFIFLLAGATAAWPLALRAQQAGKIYTVGSLTAGTGAPIPGITTLGDTLRELGWIEGKNIAFERRYAENRLDRLPALAAELVDLKVDVIVAAGTLAPLAAMRATTTIPIVMTAAGDPVGSGLVPNLARPGGNVTGLSLMGKRLELLKELLPRMSRVAVLWNAANPYPALVFKETERAAQTWGIEVQSLEVQEPNDFGHAFEAAERHQPDALIMVEDPLTIDFRKQIADFALTHRLPAMNGFRQFVDAGGLMAYGASLSDLLRRAAGWTKSSGVPNRPTCRSSSPQNSSWSSI